MEVRAHVTRKRRVHAAEVRRSLAMEGECAFPQETKLPSPLPATLPTFVSARIQSTLMKSPRGLVFNQPGFQHFLNLYLSQTLFRRGKHFNIPCFVLFPTTLRQVKVTARLGECLKLTFHLFLLCREYLELSWNGP